MPRFFTLIILISLSATAWGENCADLQARLKGVLEQSWESDYRAYQCSDNVWRLRERLKSEGLNLEPAQSVVFRRLHPLHDPLLPAQARGEGEEPLAQWSFHHVIVFAGLVLDLDFSHRPKLVPWVDYLEQMFPNQQGILAQIQPLGELQPKDLYGQFNEREYPLQALSDVKHDGNLTSESRVYCP